MLQKYLALAIDVYLGNKKRGFWDDPDRNKSEAIALMHTEVTECFESLIGVYYHGILPTAKTGAPLSIEELADTVIRVLDFCGGFSAIAQSDGKFNFPDDIDEHCVLPSMIMRDIPEKLSDPYMYKMLLGIHLYLSHAVENLRKGLDPVDNLLLAIYMCDRTAYILGYDLLPVVVEKLGFNATRQPKHGKAF